MQFDLDQLGTDIAYKLLAATVIPRPIAWVVTQGPSGLNAAPYSFFNVMGSNPPTVALGILADPARGFKDTVRNIVETSEFVVNLVPERLAEAMNTTAVNAPLGVDELALAGLDTTPSAHVTPPRITASPVSFECRVFSTVETGPQQMIVIGRVVTVHISDNYVLDGEKGYVDTPRLDLVGRSSGSAYIRTQDQFSLERPKWPLTDEKPDKR